MPFGYLECCKNLELPENPTPTAAAIKRAYRDLALVWHPDKNKAPNAEETFKKIQSSYEELLKRVERMDVGEGVSKNQSRQARNDAANAVRESLSNTSDSYKNLNSLLDKMKSWNPKLNDPYFSSHRFNSKAHQQLRILSMTGSDYFVLLLECAEKDAKGNFSDTPWNAALLETVNILLKTVNEVEQFDMHRDFVDVERLFEPILLTLEQARDAGRSLETIKQNPDSQLLYDHGMNYLTELLKRVNHDYVAQFDEDLAEIKKGWIIGVRHPDLTPCNEMENANKLLKMVKEGIKDVGKAAELQAIIVQQKKVMNSTVSLYGKKFLESISDFLLKLAGFRLKGFENRNRTYFDENIKKNAMVKSIGMFTSDKNNKKQKHKKSDAKDHAQDSPGSQKKKGV